jgi:hypothetical protein
VHRTSNVRFASGAVLLLGVTLSACAVRTPRQASIAVQPSTVDTVAAQLVELELQRISLRAATTQDPALPAVRDIDMRIQGLRQRLRSFRPEGSAQRVAADRVLLALDAREASITSQLRQLRMIFTDQYPTVRQAVEEMRLLGERRNEIRAVGV